MKVTTMKWNAGYFFAQSSLFGYTPLPTKKSTKIVDIQFKIVGSHVQNFIDGMTHFVRNEWLGLDCCVCFCHNLNLEISIVRVARHAMNACFQWKKKVSDEPNILFLQTNLNICCNTHKLWKDERRDCMLGRLKLFLEVKNGLYAWHL